MFYMAVPISHLGSQQDFFCQNSNHDDMGVVGSRRRFAFRRVEIHNANLFAKNAEQANHS